MLSTVRRIKTTKLGLNLSASIILWLLLTMIGVLLFLAWEARRTAERQVNLEGDLIGSVAANTCLQPLLENDYPTIRSRLDAMIQRLPDVVFCQVDSALPGSIGAEVSVGDEGTTIEKKKAKTRRHARYVMFSVFIGKLPCAEKVPSWTT